MWRRIHEAPAACRGRRRPPRLRSARRDPPPEPDPEGRSLRIGRARAYLGALRTLRHAGRDVYGVPWPRLWLRAARLRRAHGFALDESLAMGLLDPAGSGTHPGLVSKRETLAIQAALNPASLEPLTEDKAVWARFAAANGIPVPRTLALLERSGSGWAAGRDAPVGAADWAAVLAAIPCDVVVKPTVGWHGAGVRVVLRDGDGLRLAGRGPVGAGELAAELRAAGTPAWIVQERLVNHPDLRDLGGPGILHTVRIVSYLSPGGEVRILRTVLRVGVEGVTDNFSGGRHGNLVVDVDPATGRLGTAWRGRSDGCGLEEVARDPVSGRPIRGRVLPDWGDALDLVETAARRVVPLRTIGWDVASTPGGPVVVEANMWWDNPPTHPMRHHLERIRAELGRG